MIHNNYYIVHQLKTSAKTSDSRNTDLGAQKTQEHHTNSQNF